MADTVDDPKQIAPEQLMLLDVFHFEDKYVSFEDFAHKNGFFYWYARDFMAMLGYKSYSSFQKAINKAMTACIALNIPVNENFVQEKRQLNGKQVDDMRLSKFACYLAAMNGDTQKKEVASAQAYFATIAESFQKYVQQTQDVERVTIRDEITDNEKTLASTADHVGVTKFGLFHNKGYRGLYNMNLAQLKKHKKIPEKRPLLDFMGTEELAANLFRITQTEAKIRNDNIQGQRGCENAAYDVGARVRKTMKDLSGTSPEDLAIAQDIKNVKTNLRATQRGFAKLGNSSNA